MVIFYRLPSWSKIGIFKCQFLFRIVGLGYLLHRSSRSLLLETQIKRGKGLGFSKRFLDVFNLSIRNSYFTYKFQKELIVKRHPILTSIDEFILQNRCDHLFSFLNILLFKLKFFPQKYLNTCQSLWYLRSGIFFPFINDGREYWYNLMADDDINMLAVVG